MSRRTLLIFAGVGGLFLLLITFGLGAAAGTTKTVAGPIRNVPGPTDTVTARATVVTKATVTARATVTAPGATVQVTTTAAPVTATVSAVSTVTFTPQPVNQFADGTYVVGTDVPAGIYKTSGGDACYWARLKDLSGGVDSILANDNITGPTTVQIKTTDMAFEVNGGCQWSKIG